MRRVCNVSTILAGITLAAFLAGCGSSSNPNTAATGGTGSGSPAGTGGRGGSGSGTSGSGSGGSGSGSGGSGASTGSGSSSTAWLYRLAASGDDQFPSTIQAYSVSDSGILTANGSPVTVPTAPASGGAPGDSTTASTGQFLFVPANGSHIDTYAITSDGSVGLAATASTGITPPAGWRTWFGPALVVVIRRGRIFILLAAL